jgi:predicted PurR-regulated permease PerM
MSESQRNLQPVWFLVGAAAFVVVIAGLKAAQQLIVPFIAAIFLTILVLPPIRWLQSRKVPFGLALILVMLAVVAMIAMVGVIIGKSVSDFQAELPVLEKRFDTIVANVETWLMARGITPGSLSNAVKPDVVMGYAGEAAGELMFMFSQLLVVAITTVFLLFEASGFGRKLRLALGDDDADFSHADRAAREVQKYLIVKSITSLLTGVLVTVWVAVIGLDFPFLWGFLAFALNYVPNIGSILAAIPAVLLALVQLDPASAALIALGYLVINFIVGNVLEPKYMGKTLGLSSLVVFLSLIFWGWVWGPLGMLLSVPLTVIVKIALEHSSSMRGLAVLLGPCEEPAAN